MSEPRLSATRRNSHNFTAHSQVASWYDAKYTEMGGGWHTPIEEIDNHLYTLGLPSDARGMTLVDLGSGDGQLLMRAVLSGALCYGVEISEVGRYMTMERLERQQAASGVMAMLVMLDKTMEDTGLMNECMDFAISLGSMEHALDISAAVREMARILRPGGRFLLYVPNEEWIHEDQPLETTAPSAWWIELLEAAGLVITNDEKINDNNRITGMKPAIAGTAGI